MTLMTQLRELAAEEEAERAVELAREMETDEQRLGLIALRAVRKVMEGPWRMIADGDGDPTAVGYFDRLGLVPEVTVEREEPYPTGYRPPRRVLVSVDDLTFVVTKDRADGWELPKVRIGKFCPTCGTVVAMGGRDLRPHVVHRLLVETPWPEHHVGLYFTDRNEVCDGDEVRLADEPAPPRPDTLAELAVPSDTALAELAADGWTVHRWVGVNPGTPTSVVVVLRDQRASDEEPF